MSSSLNVKLLTPPRKISSEEMKNRIAARIAERNSWPTFRFPTLRDVARLACGSFVHMAFQKGVPSQRDLDLIFPVKPVNFGALRKPPADKVQLTWVGHATVLAQMGGLNVLTDPIFSKRCSAVQWMGPERYRKPAFTVRDLIRENVPIDVVLISHNHYDHLDYSSVRDLADLGGVTFVVPLGLREWFEENVPRSLTGGCRVVELDWHESSSVGVSPDVATANREVRHVCSDVVVTAVPMQHWSNRKGHDRDKSLWCGFSVRSEPRDCKSDNPKEDGMNGASSLHKFLFFGDSGWFDGLNDIGKEYGPFDVAAIPIGAYEPASFMRPSHMNPEEAVRAMKAVNALNAVPIHWGTFYLTVEDVMEPRERLVIAMGENEQERERFQSWYIGDTMGF